MSSTSRYRPELEPEDGELVEYELPNRPPPPKLIRPSRPPPKWSNPLEKLAPVTSSEPGPSKRPYSPKKRSIAGLSQSPEKQLAPHVLPGTGTGLGNGNGNGTTTPVSLALPPKPGSSAKREQDADKVRERRPRTDHEGNHDREGGRESGRSRSKYDEPEYSLPSSSRNHWSPPAIPHSHDSDRLRSPPRHRYDDRRRYDDHDSVRDWDWEREREDRYRPERERERDYDREDRYARSSYRSDDRARHRGGTEYTSSWGNYNSNRDAILHSSDRVANSYRAPSVSPPRRRAHSRSPRRQSGNSEDQRDKRRTEKESVNGTNGHAAPTRAPRPPSPVDHPPAPPSPPLQTKADSPHDSESQGHGRSAPIRILNRPTRKTAEGTPPPPSSAPPPPPDEQLPPPSLSPPPPPPPPDTPPPPPVPVPATAYNTHESPAVSSPGRSSKMPNRAIEATKSASKLESSPKPLPVPHAPNRNLLEPATRVSTPTNKAENPYEPTKAVARRFKQMTAAEEMSKLHKSFQGTATLAAYDMGVKLGEGTFGVVTKGVEIANKRAIALKKLITHNPRDGVSVTTVREIKILKSLDHPNVVPILNMVVERKVQGDRSSRGEVFMVFPYMDHDLCGLLANKDFKITHSVAKLLMKQILEGMAYIHANNFIHRDIKTANILVDKHGQVMIADFGLARTWTHDAAMPAHLANEYTNMVVTRWYRAPELLLGDTHYGPAVDMWSLGCVLGEMYNRQPILAGESDRDQLYQIFSRCGPLSQDSFPGWDRLPGFPDSQGHPWERTPMEMPILECAQRWGMDRGGADLLAQLLKLDPKKRLTAHDALDHPWFWTAPLPADPKKTKINVESSHEMTTRQKQEPVAPMQAARPAVRPPTQQSYHAPRAAYNAANANGRAGLGSGFGAQGHHGHGPGPGPGHGNQGFNGYPPAGGGYQPMPGQPGGNPYAPPPMQQAFAPGPGQGMGMGIGGPGGYDNSNSFGRGPNPYQHQRPAPFQNMPQGGRPVIPSAPFKLSAGGPGNVPPPPFGLAGNRPPPGMAGGRSGPGPGPGPGPYNAPMGMGGAGVKRPYPNGAGTGWRDEKRRKADEGLPYDQS